MCDKTEQTNEQKLQEIGKSAYESIAEMVAALQCDYLRLEELRDEIDGMDAEEKLEWINENPEEADELESLESEAGDCEDEDEAREKISEDPLSVMVRCGWHYPGQAEESEPIEFEILLSTGGPAVRIIGDLDQYKQPTNAKLEVQDWFLPWTEYLDADQDVLIAYCECFYFGE